METYKKMAAVSAVAFVYAMGYLVGVGFCIR